MRYPPGPIVFIRVELGRNGGMVQIDSDSRDKVEPIGVIFKKVDERKREIRLVGEAAFDFVKDILLGGSVCKARCERAHNCYLALCNHARSVFHDDAEDSQSISGAVD